MVVGQIERVEVVAVVGKFEVEKTELDVFVEVVAGELVGGLVVEVVQKQHPDFQWQTSLCPELNSRANFS